MSITSASHFWPFRWSLRATLVNENGKDMLGRDGYWGVTLGSYINSLNLTANPETNYIFAHEYGHTIQSRKLGLSYLPIVGPPSLVGCLVEKIPWANHDHDNEWYEVWANNLANDYYQERGMTTAVNYFGSGKPNPLDFHPDWYFWATLVYYMFFIDY